MSDLTGIDPFEDADGSGEVSSGDLLRLSGMVQQVESLDAEIADLENKLKDRKTKRWKLINMDLRDLLISLHVQEHASGGKRVKLATDVEAKLPKGSDERERALRWLRENKHDGIIKTFISIEFGRGHRETADRLLAEIQRLTNHPVRLVEDVHHSTYSAFARELVREGKSYPDYIGIQAINTVHIEDLKDKSSGTQRKGGRRKAGDSDEG